MYFTKITLNHFRNFHQSNFSFSPFLTIIVGKNTVGKTNLLEAIYFCLKGNGFREEREIELIRHGSTTLSVEMEVKRKNEYIIQKIQLSSIQPTIKQFMLNKIKKKMQDYIKSSMPVVIFSPSFLYVIDGQMQERRTFFDQIISRFNDEYKRRLSYYEQGLRKRNKLLEKISDVHRLREQLIFWDDYLIKEANYIQTKRLEIADFFNRYPNLNHTHYIIKYCKNIISPATLDATFEKQYIIKKTLVGPQRDTYLLSIDEKNVHVYGSRSEQRLTLFWMVMNEMRLYEEKLKQKSLILLDDIFSELDRKNKSLVIDIIKGHQTIITTIEKDFVNGFSVDKKIIQL